MPSIAQTPPGRIESKKRRRDDNEELQRASVQVHFPQQNRDLAMEMSVGKEAHWIPIASRPLRYTSKRARVSSALLYHDSELDATSHSSLREGARHGAAGEAVKEKKVDLRPCHICRRRPSDRAQLDRYADCEGCGARTCFVCMRQCEGDFIFGEGSRLDDEGDFDCLASSMERREERRSSYSGEGDGFRSDIEGNNGGQEDGEGRWEKDRVMGHRRKVCRDCCVELGAEGEVRCLGCYRVGEP